MYSTVMIYIMYSIVFRNVLCLRSYFAHFGTVSNNFNDNGQNRILGK